MADKRTVFAITADTWVEVVNGATAAKLRRGKKDATYYSMSFNDDGSVPTDTAPGNLPTAEKIFLEGIDEFVSDSAAVYLWLRCSPGEVGSVIVTL